MTHWSNVPSISKRYTCQTEQPPHLKLTFI